MDTRKVVALTAGSNSTTKDTDYTKVRIGKFSCRSCILWLKKILGKVLGIPDVTVVGDSHQQQTLPVHSGNEVWDFKFAGLARIWELLRPPLKAL